MCTLVNGSGGNRISTISFRRLERYDRVVRLISGRIVRRPIELWQTQPLRVRFSGTAALLLRKGETVLRELIRLFGLPLALTSSNTFAFIDPPTLVPAKAVAGQSVSVSVTMGFCDLLSADNLPQLTRTGNAVRILLEISHSGDSDYCFGTEPYTVLFPIGEFSAGTYIVQVDRHYDGFFGEVTENLGMLPLEVVAAPSVDPAPANGPGMLLALTLLVGLLGALRKRLTC